MSAETEIAPVVGDARGRSRWLSLVRVVVWEFVHWARWGVLTMVVVTGGGALIAHYVAPFFAGEVAPGQAVAARQWDATQNVMFAASFLMLFYGVFYVVIWPALGGDASRRRGPERLFLLPLATWKLALAYMLPGLVFVMAVSSAYGIGLTQWYALETTWWMVPCVCIALTLLGQTWVMVFAAHHRRLGFVVFIVSALLFVRVIAADGTPVERLAQGYGPWVVLLVAPVCFAIGVAGLRLNRLGGLGSFTHPLIERMEKLEFSHAPARRFASAAEAQRWYEWRRFGWLLPGSQLAAVFGFLVFIPSLIWMFSVLGDTFDSFFASWALSEGSVHVGLFLMACVAPMMTGVVMLSVDLQRHFGQAAGPPSFYLTRPVSHHVLIRARYEAVLKNIAIGFLPLAGLVAFYLSVPESREAILEALRYGETLRMSSIALVAVAASLIMWLSIWVLNAIAAMLIASFVYGPVLLAGVVFGFISRMEPVAMEAMIANASILSSIAFIPILFISFGIILRRALRSEAVEMKHVRLAVALWGIAVVCGCAVLWPWGMIQESDTRTLVLAPVIGLGVPATLLVAAPVITGPYILHRNRHRG